MIFIGNTGVVFKGTVGAKRKILYYSFDSDVNLHTYVKYKINLGNRHGIFSSFFIENQSITENVKYGVRGNEPNGSTYTVDTYINRSEILCSTKL